MQVESSLSEDGTVLTIFAPHTLDLSVVEAFEASYNKEWTLLQQVIIDLRKTEYIDSAGLGILLQLHKTLSESVNEFSIINCRKQASLVLNMSHFEKRFNIEGADV